MKYFVYILQNPAGKFYIGSTNDLGRRLQEHNSPEKNNRKFTHKNGPWRLVYSEQFDSRSEAMVRELYIKNRKSAKWIIDNLLNRQSESR